MDGPAVPLLRRLSYRLLMFSILSLLVVVILSMLVVRVATIALTLTGISRELARFQARSAFTGSGFTTSESEKVVSHPVRRRIIMLLMLLGNAGIITAMSSLILSLLGTKYSTGLTGSLWFRLCILLSGMLVIWLVAQSRWVDRRISSLIAWALRRWTTIEARDYAELLHLSGDYAVIELEVEPGDWLAGCELRTLRLNDEGILVLGIETPEGFLGAPRGHTKVVPGYTVILYGPRSTLDELDQRRAGFPGNWEHHKAVDRQRRVQLEEAELADRTQNAD